MLKFWKTFLLIALLTCICMSGESLAASDSFEGVHNFDLMGPPPPPPPLGIHLLMKYQMDNMLIEVVAEKSEQSAEVIKAELEEGDIPTLLQKYGIDREELHLAMNAKLIELVNMVRAGGRITAAQAEQIITSINAHPAP